MALTKIVFSKQADHDADLAPLWLRWYRDEFRADEILITPVKTPASEIAQTVAFYQAAGCQVRPIVLPAGWNDRVVWQRQLAMVREVAPTSPFLAVSADADQLFEPPTTLPPGKSAVPFRRINLLADGPRLGVLAEREKTPAYVGGFVGSLDSRFVAVVGHWVGPAPSETTTIEFHLQWRGATAFAQKVATMTFDPHAPPRMAHHWKAWRALVDSQGMKALEKEYRGHTARFLFEDDWPPDLRGKLGRLQRFLQGELATC